VEPATLARRRCECCRATRVPEGVAEGEPTTMPTPPSPEPVAAQGQLF
jgi:hypothetical protein